MSSLSPRPAPASPDHRRWFRRGARVALTVPGLVLCATFVGFAGLAREGGFTLVETLFMTLVVWALPAKVVLIGAVLSGSTLLTTALAVTLSSMRLMPMTVALVPELRGPRTRRWVLYGLSHFVAVTSWVVAMERLRNVPPAMRTAYYAGIGSALMLVNLCVIVLVYALAHSLPPIASAALFFLTPIYFLVSMWGSAREHASHVAMGVGLVLGPLLHTAIPGFDLFVAGLLGGAAGFAFHLLTHSRRSDP